MAETPSQDITINIKGPSELKLSVTIDSSKSVRELKDAIAEKSDVEAARQRLIYSGRVLKDEEPLTTYKIQTGHTVHMVKGVAPAQPQSVPPQRLPAMHAGQNPADPLTMLNTPMAHGALAGFNPFADMGLNTNDPNMLQSMMESPEFVNQMSSVMQRPEFVEQMIAMDPTLRDNPQLTELFRSPQFRTMMGNPEFLRSMMTLSSQMRQGGMAPGMGGMGGLGGFGGLGGLGGFGGAGASGSSATSPVAGPTTATGTPGAPVNLFGAAAASGAGGGAPAVGGGIPPLTGVPPLNLEMMQHLLGSMGGGGAGGAAPPPFNPWAALGGLGGAGAGGSTGTPVQAGPPPEERFAAQLQQLSDLGFTNPSQNVRALLATAGNVERAINYILDGGGL